MMNDKNKNNNSNIAYCILCCENIRVNLVAIADSLYKDCWKPVEELELVKPPSDQQRSEEHTPQKVNIV